MDKAVNTEIRRISPAYEEMYELMGSPQFLDLVGEISGIPGLLPDPELYGGGTHENLHGQDLDPHVDFNYDEAQKLHQRLNLIVYLNKDRKHEWADRLRRSATARENPFQSISIHVNGP
jgi:hypothetical protein